MENKKKMIEANLMCVDYGEVINKYAFETSPNPLELLGSEALPTHIQVIFYTVTPGLFQKRP